MEKKKEEEALYCFALRSQDGKKGIYFGLYRQNLCAEAETEAETATDCRLKEEIKVTEIFANQNKRYY